MTHNLGLLCRQHAASDALMTTDGSAVTAARRTDISLAPVGGWIQNWGLRSQAQLCRSQCRRDIIRLHSACDCHTATCCSRYYWSGKGMAEKRGSSEVSPGKQGRRNRCV
ncbi:unnamed protein product [Protopolystoma xenopodis]|uniref:Uncharacterized protein n=1 Tax=Protopolystoma xenopodis TaxID=117903 RepID=A0A3S5CP17_9PLAT|nr:unnamed protein product [Protopolystoma xenopodis]